MTPRPIELRNHRAPSQRRWDDEPSYRAAAARPPRMDEGLWDGDELHRLSDAPRDENAAWDSGIRRVPLRAARRSLVWWRRFLPFACASLFGGLSAVFTWHLVPPAGSLAIELAPNRLMEVEVRLDGTKRCDILPCTVPRVEEGVHTITVVTAAGEHSEKRLVEAGKNTLVQLTTGG